MRHSLSFRTAPAEPPVMTAMNMTPLIDVLLVLLIMMILTVPIMYHKVPVDLPPPPRASTLAPPPVHRLAIDTNGALSWDGAAISTASLPAHLAAMKADPAQPVLHLKAEAETPYVRFDETLATIKRAGIDKLGMVGNEQFATR